MDLTIDQNFSSQEKNIDDAVATIMTLDLSLRTEMKTSVYDARRIFVL